MLEKHIRIHFFKNLIICFSSTPAHSPEVTIVKMGVYPSRFILKYMNIYHFKIYLQIDAYII